MRHFSYTLISLTSLAASAVAPLGCSGRDDPRDAGESVRSLVRVDLSYARVAGAQTGMRFDAQAHFVRYSAPGPVDHTGVATLLGLTDFDEIPVDTCRVADGTADLDEVLA